MSVDTCSSSGDDASQKKLPTLQDLRAAIPAECFDKNPLTSIYYLIKDFTILSVLYYFRETFATTWVGYVVWTQLVGFFMWCLFVVGHDCGHGSFSNFELLNQICGNLAHTVLLVPFNGWKLSHHHHHLNHNHTENDHGWKVCSKSDYDVMKGTWGGYFRFTPVIQLIGYHYYLLAIPDNSLLSGNHFNPFSRLFKTTQQRVEAAVSTLCIMVWLYFLVKTFSLSALFAYYFVPVFICSVWLALVTLLHHTHPDSKFYDESTWDYYKGALTTIDRSYGWIIDHFHHNIETHVVHHLFFKTIPHYHLRKATAAIRPLLGDKFLYDETPFYEAYRSIAPCFFVEEGTHTPGVYGFPQN